LFPIVPPGYAPDDNFSFKTEVDGNITDYLP